MIYIYNETKDLLGKIVWGNRSAIPFRIGEKIGLGSKEYEILSITHILIHESNSYLIQDQTLVVCKTIKK